MPETTSYINTQSLRTPVRLPLNGELDLTYRCNNNCRHCWLRLPPDDPLAEEELTLSEIERIVKQARSMGCRNWNISGGEPMVRKAFSEILELIISLSDKVLLNTNGTMITPEIATLLNKKSITFISLYGADEKTHDNITRRRGSFSELMTGLSYLKEANAPFSVQVVPMKGNIHQFQPMIEMAKQFSPHIRIGASWLHGPANGDPQKKETIRTERLGPEQISACPDLARHFFGNAFHMMPQEPSYTKNYETCIRGGEKFHIDPYGEMGFCAFVKDPSLKFSLKSGTFSKGFDSFLPGLIDGLKKGAPENTDCIRCKLKPFCNWCPAFSYLEHRVHHLKIDHLCEMAEARKKHMDEVKRTHQRYYEIAGVTLSVSSEEPITEDTFHPKFKQFQTERPGKDRIFIHHYFDLPDIHGHHLKNEIYNKPPWVVHETDTAFFYTSMSPGTKKEDIRQIIITDKNHSHIKIYSRHVRGLFAAGGFPSLTLLPTDQILLSQALSHRNACYFHAAGLVLKGSGVLFAGHSDAGKSTMTRLLEKQATILCDDRIIIRKQEEEFNIHGTWSHGDVDVISPSSAPLKAIFFLKQSKKNKAVLMEKNQALRLLIECLIKPLETKHWWDESFKLVVALLNHVPCYSLYFDKSGDVAGTINHILSS